MPKKKKTKITDLEKEREKKQTRITEKRQRITEELQKLNEMAEEDIRKLISMRRETKKFLVDLKNAVDLETKKLESAYNLSKKEKREVDSVINELARLGCFRDPEKMPLVFAAIHRVVGNTPVPKVVRSTVINTLRFVSPRLKLVDKIPGKDIRFWKKEGTFMAHYLRRKEGKSTAQWFNLEDVKNLTDLRAWWKFITEWRKYFGLYKIIGRGRKRREDYIKRDEIVFRNLKEYKEKLEKGKMSLRYLVEEKINPEIYYHLGIGFALTPGGLRQLIYRFKKKSLKI